MADTKDDIVISTDDWTDVYAASTSTVGSGLIIQNKDRGLVLLRICAAKPGASDMSGFVLNYFNISYIDANETGLWAKAIVSDASINVQEQ